MEASMNSHNFLNIQETRNFPFSRSSAFCNLSSSSSSETQKHLGTTLPFLPNPFTERSPSEDLLRNLYNGEEEDSSLITLSGDACSDLNENFSLSEQMEFQFLSDELELAITDRVETPRLDEIYQVTESSPDQNCVPVVMPVLSQSSSGSEVNHKPRMRWNTELHECFLEAVKKLEGPEKATPKAVMKLMNVEGLTIYQVKSHLQKYRLAKYMPARKEGKANGNSEDKKPASNTSDVDGRNKGAIQLTESLRMQMEVQKQLHEQLEVQRSLQLRIEEHAKYLEKILDEQRKATSKKVSQFPSSPAKKISSEAKDDDECETSPKRPRLEH
ncbi:hypothetical protein AALP_AA4G004700 [Arabis alpina]|uniref:HTH myb-type domain-containing protein n=1 Tax=Arabis alpina TaxID=50452 RepID=A0A087H093_ARAAL|nr:hypothetical protein AALP_AA4G004700 [Arabis alpina]